MADWLSPLEDAAEAAAQPATNNGYAYAERGFGRVRVRYTKHRDAFRYFANSVEFTRGGLQRLDRLVPVPS